MTALIWAFRLTIFALLVVFSTQNTDPVNLRLFPGAIWQVSLVTALLVFFVGGVVLGALSLLGVIFRQRHEISRLKRVESPPPVSGKQVVPHIE